MRGGILLVNIPFYHAEAAAPPLGLAYLAAVLEREKFAVELVDAHALGMSEQEIIARVAEARPAAVGFSVMSPMLLSAMRLAGIIRGLPERPLIIFGGPHPTLRPEECLTPGGADICVRGEGEATVVELARRIASRSVSWEAVPGLSFSHEGKVVHGAERGLIDDLDAVPYPAHHLLPMQRYTTLHTGRKRYCSLMTSRGCPGRCIFCSRCIFGRTVRYRSVGNVVGEIERLLDVYKVQEIPVIDDAFAEDRDRVLRLCDEILRRGLKFAWRLGNGARVDKIDEELLRAMKKAGCYEVAFGVESGDDGVLKKIGKEVTTEQVKEAFRIAHRVGMDTIGFFMIGHPFDTVETMQKTIDFAVGLDPTYAQFTMSTPLPGTPLWKWVDQNATSLFQGDVTKLDFLGGTPHFETKHFTRKDAVRMYRRAYRRFYLRPAYALKRLCSIRSLNDLRVMLKGLFYLGRV